MRLALCSRRARSDARHLRRRQHPRVIEAEITKLGLEKSVICTGSTPCPRDAVDSHWLPHDEQVRGYPLASLEAMSRLPIIAMTSSTAARADHPWRDGFLVKRGTPGHGRPCRRADPQPGARGEDGCAGFMKARARSGVSRGLAQSSTAWRAKTPDHPRFGDLTVTPGSRRIPGDRVIGGDRARRRHRNMARPRQGQVCRPTRVTATAPATPDSAVLTLEQINTAPHHRAGAGTEPRSS
jgi:hypothetical protein